MEFGNLFKADVVEMIKDSLRLKVVEGGFTDPNHREIQLLWDDEVIDSVCLDIRNQEEYEG